MFNKILIANRGEIAVRIIEAAQELGIKSVAVYSTVDKDSIHVLKADESFHLEGESSTDTYLNIGKLIKAAKETNAEAIHPGYGFLSENYQFAKRCWDAGIVFIGPHPEAIRLMGDKIESKRIMIKANVPTIPGFDPGELEITSELLTQEAERIGYPVMLKAAAGGGGKGMRIVNDRKDLWESYLDASREAESSFGNGTVFLEKYIENPRHIEIQVLADNSGNVLHLFERECSIQRRHQKIIEETPSLALDNDLRNKMGEAAIKAAKAIKYNNAGTVEFVLDQHGNFYFLEMNTRLQVEHPITELVTGIDIVKKMIKISSGQELSFKQEEIIQRGHAIECRIYAENPDNLEFRPSIGLLTAFNLEVTVGIRNDTGYRKGSRVSVHYDPLLAKLITYGEDRSDALNKMYWALSNYSVLGVETNIEFLRDVISHINFKQGKITTNFIADNFSSEWIGRAKRELPLEILLAACLFDKLKTNSRVIVRGDTDEEIIPSPWQILGDWGRDNLIRSSNSVNKVNIKLLDKSYVEKSIKLQK